MKLKGTKGFKDSSSIFKSGCCQYVESQTMVVLYIQFRYPDCMSECGILDISLTYTCDVDCFIPITWDSDLEFWDSVKINRLRIMIRSCIQFEILEKKLANDIHTPNYSFILQFQ